MYLNRGHGTPQLLKMWRVDFGPITLTRCRGYRGACVGLPKPTLWQRNLHKVQESASSAVGDKYPPRRPSCNPRGDRAKQINHIMCLMATTFQHINIRVQNDTARHDQVARCSQPSNLCSDFYWSSNIYI